MKFVIALICLATFLVNADAQTTRGPEGTTTPSSSPTPSGPTTPRGGVTRTPAPPTPIISPRPDSTTTSRVGITTPRGGITTPRGGITTPGVGITTPRVGITTPRVGITTPRPRCRGSVARPSCHGRKDEGNTIGIDCASNANHNMWYYNRRSRSCRHLAYKGCGGNSNRYCSRRECQRRCRRRG